MASFLSLCHGYALWDLNDDVIQVALGWGEFLQNQSTQKVLFSQAG